MSKKTLITIITTSIATIAAIITIVVFLTGKQSIKEFSSTDTSKAGDVSMKEEALKSEEETTSVIEETTVQANEEKLTTSESKIDLTTEESAISTNKAPKINLEIYEGPKYSQADDLCFYRIEATVTGIPTPKVTFSRDDSNGALGLDKVQINLKRGETYTLEATATNSAGKATALIDFNWACDELYYSKINNTEFQLVSFNSLVGEDEHNFHSVNIEPGVGSISYSELLIVKPVSYMNGDRKIFCDFKVKNNPSNYNYIQYKWYKNGNIYYSSDSTDALIGTWEGMFECYIDGPGIYKIEIYYNDILILSGSCTIEP
jgi:hypothetical protein